MPVGRARARAVDQSAGIVTRNTNSWSGNECFNNANSLSVSLRPSAPVAVFPAHPPPPPLGARARLSKSIFIGGQM